MNTTTKRYFEISLVIFVISIILYTVLYLYYFDSLCDKFSGKNEQNYAIAINKLSSCKDSIVCEPVSIEVNRKNEVENWSCLKKESGINPVGVFNHFKNSIIK